MYISRVVIKNYRSIKNLTLNFNAGKNIIVGKNNSGKSNVIKAIDIVLGENSPTYSKYNNITENDFYSNNDVVENKIMIFCELKKNDNEQIDIEEAKKLKFYGKYIEDLYTEEDLQRNREIIYKSIDYYDLQKEESKEKWKSIYFKNYDFKNLFEEKISNKSKFGFLFTAKLLNGKIEKDLKFLVYNDERNWTVFFNAQLRNILLQSAIIPAFREPNQQLSLSQWSWYGKMMKCLTNLVSEEKWKEYAMAMENISNVSNNIFDDVTKTINDGTLKVAFPNTELFFRFVEEKKSELYKNVKIFINDGFMSDISLKGAGIQSAVIIGLYTYYVKNVSRVKNALLCLEEPELYLHPHGRRMISNRVNDFLNAGENQAIIVTHADEFIELKNKNTKIIKISKDRKNGTISHEIILEFCKEVILSNDNKEIFFADKVILCEGKEKFLLEFMNSKLLNGKFEEDNISVIAVNGKSNFSKYIYIAKEMNVKVYIIADFDYLLRSNDKQKLEEYDSKYHGDISNLGLKNLNYITQINDNEMQKFISKLRNKLCDYDQEKFYKSKSKQDYKDFSFNYCNEDYSIEDCLEKLRSNNIFLEDAEVEDLFKNHMNKMSEEDIYKLYDIQNASSEFNEQKFERLLEFLKKI